MAATGRREERRARQQDLGREQLLDAAEEIFGEKGFYGTTLREVADLAEFSVGSVYSFFESKDDLFRQIFVRRGEQFVPELRALLADESADPVAQLHAVVEFEVGFFRAHPHFGRLYLRHSSVTMLSTDRDIDRDMEGRYTESMALQAGLIERGQRAGVFRAGDPVVLARLLSGLVSAYQSLDPAVVAGEATERLPLADLHDVVAKAFTA